MVKSKAAQRATATWEAKAYDKVLVRLPKGTKDRIKAIAPKVNGYITTVLLQALEIDENNKQPGD